MKWVKQSLDALEIHFFEIVVFQFEVSVEVERKVDHCREINNTFSNRYTMWPFCVSKGDQQLTF